VPWVTASRWNVDSVATTGFMLSFYDSLLSGHTVDSALQLAARDVRASSAWTHPYYWAAFGVFGHS
jgi:CHAT domain-containing protein